MAQLKDLIVNGVSHLVGDVFINRIQVSALHALEDGGSTYSPGIDGQVLKSNGSTIYWGTVTAGVSGVKGNSESTYRTGQVNLTAANIGAATSSHTHGNIQNGGALQTNDVTIATGDKLVITDSSDSSKVARASISFNTANTGKCLTQAGTWADFNTYTHPTTTATAAAAVKVGNDTNGHVVIGAALTASDVGAATSGHVHGSLTNDGKLGSTANYAVVTTTGGAITAVDLSVSTVTAQNTTGTTFVSSVTQNSKGQISVTTQPLPTYEEYILPLAASGTRGGIQVGYTQSGKNYPVQLDPNTEKAYVNVPWTNVNSDYLPKAGGTMTGSISVSGNSLNLGSSSNKWANVYATNLYGQLEHSITIGGPSGKTYNGSADITVYASDLGIASALHFAGVIVESLVAESSTSPVTLASDNTSITPSDGYVVICQSTQDEFLWSEGKWHALGLASSYALHNHSHGNITNDGKIGTTGGKIIVAGTGGALTAVSISTPSASGSTTAFIDSISTASNGTITITKKNLDTSGTWSGTADKALKDGVGDTIANTYVHKSGDTMTGNLTLNKITGTANVTYGDNLPSSPTVGQIFLQPYTEVYELPTGGAANAMLIKNSATDRDVTWSTNYVKKDGDTMTGNLKVWHAGDTYVEVKNTDKSVRLELDINGNGRAGLWTDGYWTGSAFTSDSKWIIYRSTDGQAHTDLQLFGAVWNDYAEYRITKEVIEPGRCVIETGNDDLVLSTQRMQPGAEIVSDTFGFAIGETEEAKTPIASNGRVLAYPFEDIEEFRKNIGHPVCSGPNGTVSIMTDEEYQKYGYCAIGTISAIPTYEKWGSGNVKVNGRVWIRIR